ncbi:MAG: hypothetical protein WEE64_05390 [Dehalococcoidia bacterium]
MGELVIWATVLVGFGLVRAFWWLKAKARAQQQRANSDAPGIEFQRVGNNPLVQGMTRLLLAAAILGPLITLALLLAGVVDRRLFEAVLITCVLLLPVMAWRFRSMESGTIELRPDCVVVRSSSATARYHWQHIADFRVGTLADVGKWNARLARLLGADQDYPIVLIRLKRSPHFNVGLFKDELDTRQMGIPTGLRIVALFVESPEAVVQFATPYLEEARLAAPVT